MLLSVMGQDGPMVGTPRERAREQTLQDITRIGREHLAAVGAAALSLRAVARDLGVVSLSGIPLCRQSGRTADLAGGRRVTRNWARKWTPP